MRRAVLRAATLRRRHVAVLPERHQRDAMRRGGGLRIYLRHLRVAGAAPGAGTYEARCVAGVVVAAAGRVCARGSVGAVWLPRGGPPEELQERAEDRFDAAPDDAERAGEELARNLPDETAGGKDEAAQSVLSRGCHPWE
jgi:hypothetical protein